MRAGTWMPTTDHDKRNAFESDKAGTAARTRSEGEIENLRLKGGLFVEAVRATRMAMAVTDPALPGNPIVFANQSFLKLSGYSMEEVLGQQPYFMNGEDTDPDDSALVVSRHPGTSPSRSELVERTLHPGTRRCKLAPWTTSRFTAG